MNLVTRLFILISAVLFSSQAFAIFYNANFQTADLHPGIRTYEVSFEPIIYLGGANTSGFGFGGHVLFPINEDFTANVSAGTGANPFQFDSHVQYSFFPDFEEQFAFSLGGGMSYLRQSQHNHVILYVYPTTSKTFEWGGMVLTAYGYTPIGMSFFKDNVKIPIQASLGMKATNPELKNLFFYLETSLGIVNAPFIVSFGMAFQFESGT
jgi:hypothetical protein